MYSRKLCVEKNVILVSLYIDEVRDCSRVISRLWVRHDKIATNNNRNKMKRSFPSFDIEYEK